MILASSKRPAATRTRCPWTSGHATRSFAILSLVALSCTRGETKAPPPPPAPPAQSIDPWEGVTVEPADTKDVLIRTTDLGRRQTPEWADVSPSEGTFGTAPRRTFSAPAGTFTEERSVPVGAPGKDQDGKKPGIDTHQDCIEVRNEGNRTLLSLFTWHTNASFCRWEGYLAKEDGPSVVAVEDTFVHYADQFGNEGSVQGCRVRATVTESGITLEEDWPTGCTRRACGPRGTPIGRSARGTSKERCKDVARRAGAALLEKEVGPKPAWAVPADDAASRTLADYGGVWTDPHAMEVTTDTGAEGSMRVIDRLQVCGDERRGPRYALENWTVNGHACLLEGSASVNTSGDLLLVGDSGSEIYMAALRQHVTGPACHMQAVRENGRLRIKDIWPNGCYSEDCGAQAAPNDASFREARRKAVPCVAKVTSAEVAP
jgi:hypothetical protein